MTMPSFHSVFSVFILFSAVLSWRLTLGSSSWTQVSSIILLEPSPTIAASDDYDYISVVIDSSMLILSDTPSSSYPRPTSTPSLQVQPATTSHHYQLTAISSSSAGSSYTTNSVSNTAATPAAPSPTQPPSPKPPPKVPPCPKQRDLCFGISWPRTPPNTIVTRPCPSTFIGHASRKCRRGGIWSPIVNISQCTATTIEGVDEVSSDMFNAGQCGVVEMTEDSILLIRQLRNLTRPPPRGPRRRPFLNRNDLRSVNALSRRSLRLLRQQRRSQTIRARDISEVFGLFSNALDSRNRESWEELQESESGSEELLSNAEEYASITASLLQEAGEVFRFTDENIALRAERINISNMSDSVFPSFTELYNTSIDDSEYSNIYNNSIRIPSSYVESTMTGNDNTDVFISFLLFPTLQDFLPYDSNIDENTTMIGSVILSAQVELSNGSSTVSTKPQDTILDANRMIELNFFVNVSIGENASFTCVYWNFTDDFNSTSSGSWLSDGIVTEVIDNSTVRCLSSHLTSFAVLVDVSGTLTQLQNGDTLDNDTNSTTITPPVHVKALSYVSYIGTGLSVVCLVLTIIYLLTYGKEIMAKVHHFLHLNLSVSLLLGLIVFIAGIQNATVNIISCKIVAILLHYFFLSAFCWMLCEAILLYLLIVIVFTSPAKFWYMFVLFSYGVPAVIVAASFGAFRDNYIEQNLCWLSYLSHAIWTFVGPMCFIILLNTVVLVLVTIQFSRAKRKMRQLSLFNDRTRFRQFKERRRTVGDLLKGVIFLLPLLGITWIVGIFTINSNTLFFAWLFTILNSLQGVFIFIFHVLCSERVTNRLKRLFMKKVDMTQVTNSASATPMSIRKGNYTLEKPVDEDSLDKLSHTV